MSLVTQKKMLKNLLLNKSGSTRLWLAWSSLCIGTCLLLLSVMIWWNFQELLYGKTDNDSLGSSFLTISKKVTADNMSKPELTVFSPQEIADFKTIEGIQDVGQLTSNRFPAYITLNSKLGFSSDIFLEAVPNQFIDKKPDEWYWQDKSRNIPIILSAEFLNLYNYGFALSQGLPQLSASTIQALSFDLVLGQPEQRETYTAHVVGFSDRITSVLIPQNFMEYANTKYGGGFQPLPSRLIVKLKDPSSKSFNHFLEQHNYTTNSEQLRFNKLRGVVEVIAMSTGILALILMGISVLVFTLFIELTVARAQQSLVLLLQIGYNPSYLRKFMMSKFLPLMIGAVLVACAIAIVVQFFASVFIQKMNLQLDTFPGWQVWIVATLTVVLLSLQVVRAVRQAVDKI